ncbi:Murein DD-endopeptidase MepS/Murein LD-carboxypeptidase [bacterium HR13]|nr:Murein DD-endopeptidase MepS/Murein LD-carboxypeptidase [bacterium HR13]
MSRALVTTAGMLFFVCISPAMPESSQEGLKVSNADEMILTALSYIDRSYRFGSESPWAMDCSAFVQRVFRINGINLPRSVREQANYGIPVKRDNLRAGDLLFFATYSSYPSHVGIYIGDGKMIHASTTQGIVISRIDDPYWKKRFLFAKRILRDEKEEKDDIKDIILESLRDRF